MRQTWTPELSAPAEAEIVIEGRVLPLVRRPEGPLGEFIVCYGPLRNAHVFEVIGVS
jgi:UbiD family decarboxylase